eukprot:m.80758 g.80758  ORF g.80758 m.80758 type:complete len:57 (+) comp16313_c0_seq2:309-479(+)
MAEFQHIRTKFLDDDLIDFETFVNIMKWYGRAVADQTSATSTSRDFCYSLDYPIAI